MDPMQALQILDNAVAVAHLSRQDHTLVQQAIKVLADAIAPQPPAPPANP